MPKRKRSLEDDIEQKFEHHKLQISKALKDAKRLERMRMAKRLHDGKSAPDKIMRIRREIKVLNELKVDQTAHVHLCTSLLRIKGVAESTDLPDAIRNGVPKVTLSDEEKSALHNVTSGLYNREHVRAALNKSVVEICALLQVDVSNGRNRVRKERSDAESVSNTSKIEAETRLQDKSTRTPAPRPVAAVDDDLEIGSDEEEAVDIYEDMLGASSDSDDDEAGDDGELGSEGEDDDKRDELDPMEISDLSASEISEDEDIALEDDGELQNAHFLTGNDPALDKESSPEPGSRPPKAAKGALVERSTSQSTSAFMPSLMGGYISGSESASDIEVAPPIRKNRRGQKARQAIWEKKYRQAAKHLQNTDGSKSSSRDGGWDAKRGAVDPGQTRKPGQRGRRDLGKKADAIKTNHDRPGARAIAPKRKDDDGPLHPSWEARKKAKEAQATATFQGKKVVFD